MAWATKHGIKDSRETRKYMQERTGAYSSEKGSLLPKRNPEFLSLWAASSTAPFHCHSAQHFPTVDAFWDTTQ